MPRIVRAAKQVCKRAKVVAKLFGALPQTSSVVLLVLLLLAPKAVKLGKLNGVNARRGGASGSVNLASAGLLAFVAGSGEFQLAATVLVGLVESPLKSIAESRLKVRPLFLQASASACRRVCVWSSVVLPVIIVSAARVFRVGLMPASA